MLLMDRGMKTAAVATWLSFDKDMLAEVNGAPCAAGAAPAPAGGPLDFHLRNSRITEVSHVLLRYLVNNKVCSLGGVGSKGWKGKVWGLFDGGKRSYLYFCAQIFRILILHAAAETYYLLSTDRGPW